MITGIVRDKKHYPGSPAQAQHIVGTKASAFVAPAVPATPDTWYLVVEGTDKPGGKVKKHNVYVDEMAWNNVEKGSAWPVKEA